MIDLETLCAEANARLRRSIAKSAGQHKRHIRKLAERLMEDGQPRVNPTGTFGAAGMLRPWTVPAEIPHIGESGVPVGLTLEMRPQQIAQFWRTLDRDLDLKLYTPARERTTTGD